MIYYYSVNGDHTRHLLETHRGGRYQQLGEMAARFYYYEQKGNLARWPVQINLYKNEDSPLLATVKVNLVLEPHFQGEVRLDEGDIVRVQAM